eukprot:9407847-Pyramimonas_sp.AAC.1
MYKDDKPRERGPTPKDTRPSKAKGAPTKRGKAGQIAKKPRRNSRAGLLVKAARLTHKLATYFAAPIETPSPAEICQPYPVYEQRAPPIGVPERDRWERSEELRERREEDKERERREQEARREQDTRTREEAGGQTRKWAQGGEELEEGQPLTMATWNCCSLRTTNSKIAGQSDLEKVLEETEARVTMLQETRVRQAHKRTRPIENASYRTYYSSPPASRTRSGKKIILKRHQQHTRAGVATMVHKDMLPDEKVTRVQEPDQLRGYALCLKVTTTRGPVHVINVYTSPRRTHAKWKECPPRRQSDSDTPVIVGGDYNETWYPSDRPRRGAHQLDNDYRRWAVGWAWHRWTTYMGEGILTTTRSSRGRLRDHRWEPPAE